MNTPRKTTSAKKAAAFTTSTTNLQSTTVNNAFHIGKSSYSVALGTIKKSQEGGFSKITVPNNACDTALKGDRSGGFKSISAVFTQLESRSTAPLPEFQVAGNEYKPHKLPKMSNCFYGLDTKGGSRAAVLAVRTDNGYVVIAMVDDWRRALNSVRTLAQGLQKYGGENKRKTRDASP
ncbi:hypothetical protein VSDG_07902 [Cytospora chrysosperma]|uniref:Profilin n=1 Tax=Cytospora chrysosperma TaxID=252740 RepID=A0A423VKR5_CYTCH|nr:hypothetical protein VSDG_07902 [Valsa sordida]